MKHVVLMLVATIVSFGSCNNSGESKKTDSQTETDSTKTTAMYVCPMHPEITSDKPASCSECGMDLEKTK